MLRKLMLVLGLLLFIAASAQALLPAPQWGRFGIVVNDTPGNTIQQNPRAVKFGQDYLVVWEDFRAGHIDLYAQKMDAKGKILWDKDGIPICTATGDQNYFQILKVSEDQAVIVWQDNRGGNFDIYAQKIDLEGKIIWPENGVQVCGAIQGQVFPQLAADGSGGAFVVWHDYRSGTEDIYAQWLGADGNLYWKETGIPVCTESGTQWFPKIIGDQAGGAIVTWVDRRKGNLDIFAQRLSRKGELLWNAAGVEVCGMEGNQDNPILVTDGDQGAIIAWQDLRPGNPGIYAQKLIKDGVAGWTANGILLGLDSTGPGTPVIASDSMGGAVVAWSDPHAGDLDLYTQHIDQQGKLNWGHSAMPLVSLRGIQENPRIEGTGPWAVVWEDLRSSRRHLYAQLITRNGSYAFGLNGIAASPQANDPQSPSLVLDGNRVALFFQDKRRGNFDIFAQVVEPNGEFAFGKAGALINATSGSVVQQNAKAVRDEQGNYLFAFEDFRWGFSNIYLQKVSPTGKLLWAEGAVSVAPGYYHQKNPELIADGSGGAIVVWEDDRDIANTRIYAQRISFSGQTIWLNGGVMLTPRVQFSKQSKPKIVPDGEKGAIVVFCDYRGTMNYQDIFSQRIDPQGKLLWHPGGNIVCAGNSNQDEPQIAPKSLVVCWTDHRMGERNSDIYAQKLGLDGKNLWEDDGVPVCEAPDSQHSPNILDNGQGGVIILWTDRGGGGYDIYAQRIDINGKNLWLKDGIPICQAARTQQNPRACLTDTANIFVVWEDFRFGNWDILGQRVNDDGRLKYDENGISICQVESTQYSPDVICVGGNLIVAWEDYRNGLNYNIFLQSLDQDGLKMWGEGGVLVEGSRAGGRVPRLLAGKGRDLMVSWEDYRLGGRGIYAQRFTFLH